MIEYYREYEIMQALDCGWGGRICDDIEFRLYWAITVVLLVMPNIFDSIIEEVKCVKLETNRLFIEYDTYIFQEKHDYLKIDSP